MNALADRVRAIPARAALDECPTTVTIRVRTFAGGRAGTEGTKTDSTTTITPTPRVQHITEREIANSAGRYRAGDVRVGPLTPSYGAGGYTEAQLAPPVGQNGVQVIYILAGNVNGEYERIELHTEASHSWWLVLRRRRSTP